MTLIGVSLVTRALHRPKFPSLLAHRQAKFQDPPVGNFVYVATLSFLIHLPHGEITL